MKTLADRAAGLVLAGFDGLTAAQAPAVLKDLAGIVLFARNVQTADQTAALIRDVQASRPDGAPPLIVAVDEEGGPVSRLRGIGAAMPSAMAMGASGDPNVTRDVYRAIGEELSALGMTLDLAPVADANTNPANPVIGVRSFGDARIAAEHVPAAIAGLRDAGVGAVAKHFPGHGDTDVDSHTGLPVIARAIDELFEVELVPFRAAIAAGVDAIMTAHIALPNVDPTGAPATMSRVVLTGLLRERLGYDGVICTDCMQMQAIAATYPPGEAAVMAIAAGADLVTFASKLDAVQEAIAALAAAVTNGRLEPAQVERSLDRVAKLRTRLAAAHHETAWSDASIARHRAVALDAARMAVTIVRDPATALPLRLVKGQRIFIAQFAGGALTQAESTGKQTTEFGKLLARGQARVQEQIRSLDPAGHEYKQLLMAAASADAIIAVSRRAWAHPLQAQAINDLALAGKPLVVVAAREPYDATVVPQDAAVIASFGDDPPSMEAAAEVLLGERPARGRSPVAIGEVSASQASR